METIKISELIIDSELKSLFEKLINNGFRLTVHAPSETFPKTTYAHVWKNDKGCYIQLARFGGLDITTLHKPSRIVGTGYQYANGADFQHPNILKSIEDATNCTIPHGFHQHDYKEIVKYKSLEDYAKQPTSLKIKQLILN